LTVTANSLNTARLNLSPFALSDADELFLIRGDSEAMRYWDWPADKSRMGTLVVAREMLHDASTGAAKIWTARLGDGAFVGVVDLSAIMAHEADLGFMIRRDYWGRGYAFGAAMLAILNAKALGMARLKARIHADNLRSRKLLERLGFAAGETRDMEIRPGVAKRCQFFALENLAARFDQGSSSLSQ